MKKLKLFALSLITAAGLAGCGEDKIVTEKETSKFNSTLTLTTQPVNPLSVVEARAKVSKGTPVIVIGDIGGRVPPFVGNRAAFILVDENKITSCDKVHGDRCKAPWDYCCEDPKAIAQSILVIQVLDDNNKVIKQTLKGWNSLKELSKVIIEGTYDKTSTLKVLVV